MNSALHEEEICLYRDVHVGIAVALDDGLIVPVVRDAKKKGVAQITAKVNDLVLHTHEGRMAPAEVRGKTFSISNLGPFSMAAHFIAYLKFALEEPTLLLY